MIPLHGCPGATSIDKPGPMGLCGGGTTTPSTLIDRVGQGHRDVNGVASNRGGKLSLGTQNPSKYKGETRQDYAFDALFLKCHEMLRVLAVPRPGNGCFRLDAWFGDALFLATNFK